MHDGNARHVESDASISGLAADIEARGLLQSLSVRALNNEAGEETGEYGVQAGGRRLRGLQLLVKQKKLAKDAPIPCIVRTGGFVEADSLAENVEREALHPLDQFGAFKALADQGQGEETIAAAFRVTPAVVKQRLRLAKASPVLLNAYREDEITLDQLMAFCLTEDHARQEQVLEAISRQWNKSPEAIKRMIAETSADAEDRRALFVGLAAYEAAGGFVLRDLFDENSADGFRIPRSSIVSSPKSLRPKRPRSVRKAGSGSKRRSTSPGTTSANTGCFSRSSPLFRLKRKQGSKSWDAARRTRAPRGAQRPG